VKCRWQLQDNKNIQIPDHILGFALLELLEFLLYVLEAVEELQATKLEEEEAAALLGKIIFQ
jgi:hypothetical protein